METEVMRGTDLEPLIVERNINAPVAKVFQAWTQPQLLQRWFFPGSMTCDASTDFRVGGAYRMVMHGEDGDYPHYGEYREIVDQEKIVFTWNSNIVSDSLVTVEFFAEDNQTRLVLTHDLLPNADVAGKHSQGWAGCLANLTALFSN